MLEITACVLQPNCGEELLLKRLAHAAALHGVFTLKEEQNQSKDDLTGFRNSLFFFQTARLLATTSQRCVASVAHGTRRELQALASRLAKLNQIIQA